MRQTTAETGSLAADLSSVSASCAVPTRGMARPMFAYDENVLRDRLDEMTAHLRTFHPVSGNEALKLLRSAFPDSPLADRVKALQSLGHF